VTPPSTPARERGRRGGNAGDRLATLARRTSPTAHRRGRTARSRRSLPSRRARRRLRRPSLRARCLLLVREDWGSGTLFEVRGAENVARRAKAASQLGLVARPALINGAAGWVSLVDGEVCEIAAFTLHIGRNKTVDILPALARLALTDFDLRPLRDSNRPKCPSLVWSPWDASSAASFPSQHWWFAGKAHVVHDLHLISTERVAKARILAIRTVGSLGATSGGSTQLLHLRPCGRCPVVQGLGRGIQRGTFCL
jgi:hypothetical protein